MAVVEVGVLMGQHLQVELMVAVGVVTVMACITPPEAAEGHWLIEMQLA